MIYFSEINCEKFIQNESLNSQVMIDLQQANKIYTLVGSEMFVTTKLIVFFFVSHHFDFKWYFWNWIYNFIACVLRLSQRHPLWMTGENWRRKKNQQFSQDATQTIWTMTCSFGHYCDPTIIFETKNCLVLQMLLTITTFWSIFGPKLRRIISDRSTKNHYQVNFMPVEIKTIFSIHFQYFIRACDCTHILHDHY